MSDSKDETKAIKAKELIQIFKDIKESKSDSRFCFILGAGVSVTSGIPSGSTLAKKWFSELKDNLKEELDKWVEENQIDTKKLEEFYPLIYQKRYENFPKSGFDFLENIMQDEKVEPNIGYAIFAQLLAKTHHNIVITTNFDFLLEDSIFLYTKTHPLTIGHESITEYIKSYAKRPTILKIHRDLFLEPKNNQKDIERLSKEWRKSLTPIITEFPMVVLGYAGNDGSLMNFLKSVKNRKPIYWCIRGSADKLNQKTKELLNKDDRIVIIDGFDEFMVELLALVYRDEFEPLKFEKPEESNFVKDAIKRVEKYSQKYDELTKKENSDEFKEIVHNLTYWWEYQEKIEEAKTDEEKEKIYLEGIKKLPTSSELICNYGLFLYRNKKDYDSAEKHYLIALKFEPENSYYNNCYTRFLDKLNPKD